MAAIRSRWTVDAALPPRLRGCPAPCRHWQGRRGTSALHERTVAAGARTARSARRLRYVKRQAGGVIDTRSSRISTSFFQPNRWKG